ncbi:MAG: hypothetical protein Q8936_23990 [Bacillota bacterium]|nr:hypothetical protein [Bacillota bacterium]
MDEYNVNSVDAGQENVVDSPTPENVEINSSESVNGDVATSTPEPSQHTQTPEQNAMYANIRRQAEREAEDRLISQMYGASHGIHTKAEYDRAVQAEQEAQQRQQMEQAGINPDLLKSFVNELPEVKQAREFLAKQQQDTKLQNEVTELLREFPDADISKVPENVLAEGIQKGIPLIYVYSRYASKNALTIAEQRTLQNLKQNSMTSPGSLSGTQEQAKTNINAMSNKDFDSLLKRVMSGERIEL